MERYINILIIDEDVKNRIGLKEILGGSGNVILMAQTCEEAIPIIQKKEVGIILVNIDSANFQGIEALKLLKAESCNPNTYKIVISKDVSLGAKLVHGMGHGAVDFITVPFNPNLVRAKIDVFKSLFYKDQRIGQLLANIFPTNVLSDLSSRGKFSPKRIESGVVMFTDFVDFSSKAITLKPLALLNKLETYFTAFDEIIERYKIEKIKTIGDAYMALGGVTEDDPHPAIRACLAAVEIKNYMYVQKQVARAMGHDFWDIRIGLHMGPLVSGIIGTKKINFDVWGDTVNIAARAEHASIAGKITITENLAKEISEYFIIQDRGEIELEKRGGSMNMFFLKSLKKEHSLYQKGIIASTEIRKKTGLSTIDFANMRIDIINRLKAQLPEELLYHDVNHTLNVEKSAVRFAILEGIKEDDMYLLQTAALYHDAGFIVHYHQNEDFAIKLAENNLPIFGYNEEQIAKVCEMIHATRMNIVPETLLQKILCDADHDYLGRADYYQIAKRLRQELEMNEKIMDEIEWLEFQLKYLENIHVYFTESAQNIRLAGKNVRIEELKKQLDKLSS